MLLWIVSILTLLTATADIVHFFRLKRRTTPLYRWSLGTFALTTDLLPVLIAVTGVLSRDNGTGFMTFAMWAFWLWIVTVLPRMIYYLFRLVRLPRVGIAVAVCVALFFVWGATLGRTTVRVNRIEICSERIPAGFDGFRIAQFSDMHLGTIVRPEKELGRIVERINAENPHLIIFTGDLVNIRYNEIDARAKRLLGGLRAPYGVVSVTGNHDVGTYIKDSLTFPAEENLARVIARQREMGWRVLEDTTVYLNRGGESISLTGISFDPRFQHIRHAQELGEIDTEKIYRDIPDSMYNITAVHIPQLWGQVTRAGYGDLTLSGHVHSMQMKIRLFGRAFSPAQWLYSRWSGRYDEGGRTLYINDGTGYVAYPMRLGAYPEITLITLKRCE